VPPKIAISRNFGCLVFRLVRRQAEALPDLLLMSSGAGRASTV
jgi:hypothetical protein